MRKTLLLRKLSAALQRAFGPSYSELYLHSDSQPQLFLILQNNILEFLVLLSYT